MTEKGINLGQWRRITANGAWNEVNAKLGAYNEELKLSIQDLIDKGNSPEDLASAISGAGFECAYSSPLSHTTLAICRAFCTADMPMAQKDFWEWKISLVRNWSSNDVRLTEAELAVSAVLY